MVCARLVNKFSNPCGKYTLALVNTFSEASVRPGGPSDYKEEFEVLNSLPSSGGPPRTPTLAQRGLVAPNRRCGGDNSKL